MSVFDKNLSGKNKIDLALDRIKEFYLEPYYVAFSGGKDSIVVAELMKMSGVDYELHNNHTTVDPPEVVYFIREHYPECIVHKPEISMWRLIEKKKMPPTRMVRYCCDYLKEGGGQGRFVVTGVRWAESARRKNSRSEVEIFKKSKAKKYLEKKKVFLNSDNDEKRRMIEACFSKEKKVLNPIIDWSDEEVWEFINYYKLPYPDLYDKGYKRVGCVGCPLSSNARKELEVDYPKYKKAYLKAFEKMLENRKKEGMETEWSTPQEVFDWWLPVKK